MISGECFCSAISYELEGTLQNARSCHCSGLWNGEVHGLTIGCLNGNPGIEIEAHLFVGSKAPWDHIGGDAPQYDEFPVPKKE